MDALIASLPILMVVIAMLGFGLPAKIALPIGWLATLAVALAYWGQDALTAVAWAADGFLESLGTLTIVFGAILVMNTLKHSGAVAAIQRGFNGINPDRRVQAVIVSYAFAIAFGVSMVYLYRNTGVNAALTAKSMVYVMAESLAGLFSTSYLAVAPFIGVLGAFMSGSNTVSNMLFAPLQYETAGLVNLAPIVVLALQNIGGAAGNMICVNNVVAVCATTGVAGNEGRIIRINLLPCLVYCVIVVLVLGFWA